MLLIVIIVIIIISSSSITAPVATAAARPRVQVRLVPVLVLQADDVAVADGLPAVAPLLDLPLAGLAVLAVAVVVRVDAVAVALAAAAPDVEPSVLVHVLHANHAAAHDDAAAVAALPPPPLHALVLRVAELKPDPVVVRCFVDLGRGDAEAAVVLENEVRVVDRDLPHNSMQ